MDPVELEREETTDSNTSASHLDLHVLSSIRRDGQLHTSIFMSNVTI